jgi:topoisomerase-4 subunit B
VARAKRKTEEPGLFDDSSSANGAYTANDIEVLEGLEPVRRRPGMYIGGTDDRALHHLAAEILDNSMDEAVAGHADRIEMSLDANGTLSISDNGRGIPIDPHPKYKGKSALEVILTTLHSGGKFDGKVYQTSGGLHGVGLSVVNALASELRVEVARDKQLWVQEYSRGAPTGKLTKQKGTVNRRGTTIAFHPDAEIFGAKATFEGKRLYDMAKAKAYLFRGVEIRWSCDPAVATDQSIPEKEIFQFPDGILDYLRSTLGERPLVGADIFAGRADLSGAKGRIEWAISWQHGSHARRWQPCGWHPGCPDPWPERLWRTDEQSQGRATDSRRHFRRCRNCALAVHRRTAVSGTDQGKTVHARGGADR